MVFHYVQFEHAGRTWYAVREKKPTGVERPENRCLFKKVSEARELERFLKLESTFDKIELGSIEV